MSNKFISIFILTVVCITSNCLCVSEISAVGAGKSLGKDGSVSYIDLSQHFNRKFQDESPSDGSDGWTDQGSNDMRYIPRGYQKFRNVPFFVNESFDNLGVNYAKGCIALNGKEMPELPQQTDSIRVDAAAKYLYFLHTCGWATTRTHCADYTINYEDGTKEIIPLSTDEQIGDWWNPEDKSNAYVGWIGQNEVAESIGFYIFEWKNTQPDKKIESIVFKSQNAMPVPILIAITASSSQIKIGDRPNRMEELTQNEVLCEYRQRPETSLYYEKGPQNATVKRILPIDKQSIVKDARIDVIRFNAEKACAVSCAIAGVDKLLQLKESELKASFVFTEPNVISYLNSHKDGFEINVKIDDPCGIGIYKYEGNPNQVWIPGGEDVKDGVLSIAGVFTVTGWLKEHKYSKYIEVRPKQVDSKVIPIQEAVFEQEDLKSDWLDTKLCLNGPWLWQAEKDSNVIPENGWSEINIPADVGEKIKEINSSCIGAWFKKEIFIPADWADKRVSLEFVAVADFADIYVNNKKCFSNNAGRLPFEVDISDYLNNGNINTIYVHCRNVKAGIIPYRRVQTMEDLKAEGHEPSKFKGYAYRVWIIRGAIDQNPDNAEILYDGKNVGKKVQSIEEVTEKGDGRYFREQFWNHSILYFSTPGNVELNSVFDRLAIGYIWPGITKHFTPYEPPHHWRDLRARTTGITQDVFLNVTGKTHISNVFIKPSVRKMQLAVDLEIKNIPASGAKLSAVILDSNAVVLDMQGAQLKSNTEKITLSKPWASPQLWGPTNPHLYFLKVEITDSKTGKLIERIYRRFGFKEFWIEGTSFYFNGKPFMIQGTSKDPALFMPSHRAHIRWFYADYTQQANINMLRWYPDGTSYPSFADVADEMGMLLKTSASFEILTQRLWCWDEQGNYLESEADKVMDWVLVQLDYLKNHPSIAMWSTSNENFTVRSKEPATKLEKEIVSAMLRMSEKAQKFDPTRVDHLQGTNGLIYKGMTDDPRLQVVDGHYVELDVFKDWKNKYGKPCSEGEISLGGDFAWTYQNEALASINEGKDPTEKFWRRLNSGTKTVAQRIQYWRSIELPGIWPFEGCMTYHPLMEIWPNVKFGQMTPVVNWPAQSGPDTKPESYVNGRTSYNFWDTNSPRTMHLRTYDALKDNFKEVPKLQPKFSPEIIVQVIDENDNPVYNSIVWLIPTNQPTGPLGSLTDKQGKAWFWCKAGGGEYTAWVKINENWYSTKVEPAVMGEWMQVKTVRTKVLNTR